MPEKYCKYCKTTLSAFYATGMLGCPNCYRAFEKELSPVLYKLQGTDRHETGAAPKIRGIDKELLTEYERLKKERELAGIEGRFSDMAEFTHDIFDIKTELEKRGLL